MDQLGHYQIIEEIGRGGMGVVYRALDPMIGRLVAIKVIRLREVSDPGDREFLRKQLFKEARAAGTMSHSGIVVIHQIAEQDGLAYIVMEFVSGVTLDRLMTGRVPLQREVIAKVVEQTSAALDYAHRKLIVHRDIKPPNLMLNDEGSVKVCDFGIAKSYLGDASSTRTGMVLGTPHYMSPEQVQGRPLDGRTDQYSLAVVTYQMLTGQRPFQADTIETLFYKILYEDAAALCRGNPAINPAQAEVLGRALAKDAAARYDTCGAFAQAFLGAGSTAKRAVAAEAPPPLYAATKLFAEPPLPAAPDATRVRMIDEAILRANSLREQKDYAASLALLDEIGDVPGAAELKARVLTEQAEGARQRQIGQFESAMARADEELAKGNIAEAQWQVEELARDKPAGFAITSRLVDLRNRIAAARKKEQVAERCRAALELVEGQRFEEACDVLDDALQQYPGEPGLTETLERVQIAQQAWARGEAIRQAVEKARSQRDSGNLEGALATVGAAMQASGSDAELAALDRELRGAIEERRRRKLEQERAEKLSRGIAQIEYALATGDLPRAQAALREARDEFGSLPVFVAVSNRVEAAVRQAEEEARKQRRAKQEELERLQAEEALLRESEAQPTTAPQPAPEFSPPVAPEAAPGPPLFVTGVPKSWIRRPVTVLAGIVAVLVVLFYLYVSQPKAGIDRAESNGKPGAGIGAGLKPPSQNSGKRDEVRPGAGGGTSAASKEIPPPAKGDEKRPVVEGPTIDSFTAEPGTIQRGQASTLRWSVKNATGMTIDQGIGSVQPSGSRQVNPGNTTAYTLVANGPGGSDSRSVTVTVEVPLRAGQTRQNSKDGLTYVYIPPARFTMGCSPGDSECGEDEKPAHEVTITKGFWMGQTEVTQAAYERVIGPNPSHFKGAQLPVENVNWNDAKAYCEAIGGRLPTEAEWEYAARAGNTAARYGTLDEVAWYATNSGGQTHAVGQKQPNAWKLYDMLGNVWEWTADRYDASYYGKGEARDPAGPSSGVFRTLRGGSWVSVPRDVRVSVRVRYVPAVRYGGVGFRCAGE